MNKISILCGLVLISSSSLAADPKNLKWDNRGLIDGLYECDVKELSWANSTIRRTIKANCRSLSDSTYRKILTFSGKSDGSLLYTVGKTGVQATDENSELSGYGVGSIATGSLIGATWNGGAFQMDLVSLNDTDKSGNYDGLTVKGKVFIRTDSKTNQAVEAEIICRKAESLLNLLKQ